MPRYRLPNNAMDINVDRERIRSGDDGVFTAQAGSRLEQVLLAGGALRVPSMSALGQDRGTPVLGADGMQQGFADGADRVLGFDGSVISAPIASYFRSDRRFLDLPAGFSYAQRWTFHPTLGGLRDEVGGAAATRSGTASVVAHPTITSRCANGYNGTNQYDTLPQPFPYDLNTAWSIFVLVVPNVTRSGGASLRSVATTQISGGNARGIDISVGWDGTSKTACHITLNDDFGAGRYTQLQLPEDLANGTPYLIGIHCDPALYNSGIGRFTQFRATINGIKSVLAPVNGASHTLMTTINSGQALRIGASWGGARFFPGTIASIAVFGQDVDLDDAAAIAKVELGVGRRCMILSTDCANDPEDLAALDVAIALALSGGCDLLGVVSDSSNDYTAPCIRAQLNARGCGFVPVAAWQGSTPSGTPSVSSWAQTVRNTFATYTNANGIVNALGANRADAQYSSAIVVRGVAAANPTAAILAMLASGTAGNIDVVHIGFAGPMAAAIDGNEAAFGDAVRAVHIMGGFFQADGLGQEFNIRNDIAAWQSYLGDIPATVPIYFYGSELVGSANAKHAPYAGKSTASNPAALGWSIIFGNTTFQNFSWDTQSVLLQTLQPALTKLRGPGKITISSDGATQLDETKPQFPHYFAEPKTTQAEYDREVVVQLSTLVTPYLP